MPIRRMRSRSDLTDKRETVHESAIRALREAQETIGTLEAQVRDLESDLDAAIGLLKDAKRNLHAAERERDDWRKIALQDTARKESTNDTH